MATDCVRILVGFWVALLVCANPARAQPATVVVWVGSGGAASTQHELALEQALRLELAAHGALLLTATPAANADGRQPPALAELAREALARSAAQAALWLEADRERPVSWLQVIRSRGAAAQRAPLPHPPGTIDPQLFAIAAASLIDQVLRAATTEVAEAAAAVPVPPPAAAAATVREPVAPSGAAPAPKSARPPAPRPPPPAAAATPWFVQAGFSLAYGLIGSGLEADRAPPPDRVFVASGQYDDTLPWVPDADSSDRLGIIGSSCEADGRATTGPDELPSKYCVRVERPGFVQLPALRLALGLELLPRFDLALVYQYFFGIESDGFFDAQLFGLEAEYLAVAVRSIGLELSPLLGVDAGRTDTPGPSPLVTVEGGGPNALTGPLGIHAGLRVRYLLGTHFGFYANPLLGVRFPALQFMFEFGAGLELRL